MPRSSFFVEIPGLIIRFDCLYGTTLKMLPYGEAQIRFTNSWLRNHKETVTEDLTKYVITGSFFSIKVILFSKPVFKI